MKINKYILGLAAVVLGGFSSCNTDVQGTVYNPSYEHVSFDGSSASVSVSVDETSATIPVTITRGMVANASTFTFSAEASAEGIFSNDANGTVSFAAGQNSTTFNVTASNLEKDQSYTYTLTLSDAAVEIADVVTNVTGLSGSHGIKRVKLPMCMQIIGQVLILDFLSPIVKV